MNLLPSRHHPVPFLVRLLTLLPWLLAGHAPAETPPPHRFEKDIQAFEAADRKSPPPKGAILFVGDSTFTRWQSIHDDLPGYTVINRGFGGSEMSDLLFFTDRIVLPYAPRLIVLQEGGNDLHAGKTPEQLVADLQAFVEKVHAALPAIPIIIGGITANPARWSEADTRRHANRIIASFATTAKGVQFVNFFDPMLGPDGTPRGDLYGEDHLHPSALGYQLRAQILRPLLGPPDKKP